MKLPLAVAMILALGAFPARAQEMDHSMHAPPQETQPDPHAGHHMPPAPPAEPRADPVDHAAMGHDMHAGENAATDLDLPSSAPPLEPIPTITPTDRLAAFPDVAGHSVHDNAIHSYWLLDRLEAWDADTGTGIGWEAMSWIGTDLDRVWLRSEGEHANGAVDAADVEVLYGRAIAPWWDVLAGVRHDFGEGPSQTFAAIGVQGLSTYMFEIGATAYVGESGQTAASLEIEYETLFTNRLILQWMAEAELHGKDDERRNVGAGLGTVEAGLRLRYEVTRQFAPYIGVVHERAYGNTADFRRADGEDIDDTRVVAGLRLWF